jgi:hypothetical protein
MQSPSVLHDIGKRNEAKSPHFFDKQLLGTLDPASLELHFKDG